MDHSIDRTKEGTMICVFDSLERATKKSSGDDTSQSLYPKLKDGCLSFQSVTGETERELVEKKSDKEKDGERGHQRTE